MALSVTQNMNMNFLNSLMPRKEEDSMVSPGGKQPVTITSIAAARMDSFEQNIAFSIQTTNYIRNPGHSTFMFSTSGGTMRPLSEFAPLTIQNNTIIEMPEPDSINVAANQNPASNQTVAATSEESGAKWNVDVKTDNQRITNANQANQIKKQLNLSGDLAFGVETLGEDLAVFGLDFTALAGDRDELLQSLHDKAMEMVADIDNNHRNDSDYDAQRRVVSGAYARLQNGLGSANNGGGDRKVTVDGKSVDANFVVSVSSVLADPLVLDLNGDGINLKGAQDGVEFDMDGDGEKTKMGFIQGDDALLFIDSHGDGMVHDGRQLFGNSDGHANGFEKLRSYDDNGDGVIDEQDAIYDQLGVWVEKNENGVSDEGETMSLRDAGITSINVGYVDVREDDGTGNLIGQKGEFTRNDGTKGLTADAWFQELR